MIEPAEFSSSFADAAQIAADISTVVAAIVVGAWAYTRNYGQQIARPAVELNVDATKMGQVAHRLLLRVTLSVRNAGSRECRVFLCWKLASLDGGLESLTDISYHDSRTNREHSLKGQVKFARQVPVRPTASQVKDEHTEGLAATSNEPSVQVAPQQASFGRAPANYEPVLPYTTFVGPGITQRYEFATSVPVGSIAAAIVAYIQYERPRSQTEALLARPVRVLLGLSFRATKATTFDHTTVGIVEFTPHSEPVRDRIRSNEGPATQRGGVARTATGSGEALSTS
jgi:hypothetical protein